MPSSFTERNRLDLQATGENLNTWGARLNDGAFNPIDFALDGVVKIEAAGPTTLSTANGAADQARGRVINVTASAAATIIIPSVEKLYAVRAASAPVSITNGSSQVTLPAGSVSWIVTDGSSIWVMRSTDLGGARLLNVGAPVANTDGVNKLYVDQTAFQMAAGNLPGQNPADAGKALVTDGASMSWGGPFAPINDVFVDVPGAVYALTAADAGKVLRFTSDSPVVVTLPNSLPAGWNALWSQLGTGQVTFTPASGAIRRNRYGHAKSSGQFAEGSLRVDENPSGAASVYVLSGDTAA